MDEQRSRGAEGAAAGRVRPATGAVTLKQVAAEAEVSLATASRVLHRSGGREVRGPARERVQAAAERLGYVSNPHAQALARARSSTVGLIVHDVTDPYFAAIATGAMHAAHAEGVMVMMAATFRDPELELDYLGRLRAQGARGVLLAGSGSTDDGSAASSPRPSPRSPARAAASPRSAPAPTPPSTPSSPTTPRQPAWPARTWKPSDTAASASSQAPTRC